MDFIKPTFGEGMKQTVFDFYKPFTLRFTDQSAMGFCFYK